MKYQSKFIYFHSREFIWKCREIGRHLVSVSMCQDNLCKQWLQQSHRNSKGEPRIHWRLPRIHCRQDCWDCVAVYQLVNICHIIITLQPCSASAIYSWYPEYQSVTKFNISSLHLKMWANFSWQKKCISQIQTVFYMCFLAQIFAAKCFLSSTV